MFDGMNGRRLAGWGYFYFWTGLLAELTNTIVSARVASPLHSSFFWGGLVLAMVFVGIGIRMMLLIQHRPW